MEKERISSTARTNLQKTSKNHVTPAAYLGYFTNGSNEIVVLNKKYGTTRSSSPKGAGYEIDFYTTDTITEKDSDAVEKGLSKVETLCLPILLKMKNREKIGTTDLLNVALYVALQYGRTPSLRNKMDEYYTVIMNDLVKEELAKGILTQQGYEDLRVNFEKNTDEKLPDMDTLNSWIDQKGPIAHGKVNNAAFVRNFMSMGDESARQLVKFQWTIIHAPKGSSFITSDSPILLRRHEALKPFEDYAILLQGVERYFPIDSKTLLAISNSPTNDEIHYSKMNKRGVRKINQALFAEAYEYVYASSKSLLVSLSKSASID